MKLDLVKLVNYSNLVEIADDNKFNITEEGMAEEEKRVREIG